MKRDGSPETELEASIIDNGIAKLAMACGLWGPATKAQADRVDTSDLSYHNDPVMLAIYETIQDISQNMEDTKQQNMEHEDAHGLAPGKYDIVYCPKCKVDSKPINSVRESEKIRDAHNRYFHHGESVAGIEPHYD